MQETSASKSREQQRVNSQLTLTHAGGDHKLAAAAAFGAPIPNFGGSGGGATGAVQGSTYNRTYKHICKKIQLQEFPNVHFGGPSLIWSNYKIIVQLNRSTVVANISQLTAL